MKRGVGHEQGMTMSSSAHLLIFFIFLISTASTILATDHIVGANRGWNPGINYTLWANNHTFYVGDLISFRYQKNQYNVFEVNQSGYDNCTTEGAFGNWSSGKDFVPLNDAKRYYFICGNGQCYSGMKVSVVVHPLPTAPTPHISLPLSSHSAAPMPVVLHRGWGFRLLPLLLFFCFDFVWISSDWM